MAYVISLIIDYVDQYDYITLVTFVLLLYLLSSFKTMLHISIQWRKYWFSQMTTLFCLSLIRQHLWSVHETQENDIIM
jgi:hypothetical protein